MSWPPTWYIQELEACLSALPHLCLRALLFTLLITLLLTLSHLTLLVTPDRASHIC